MHKVVRPHLAQASSQLAHQVLGCGLGNALDAAQEVRQVAAGTKLHHQVQPVSLLQCQRRARGVGEVEQECEQGS